MQRLIFAIMPMFSFNLLNTCKRHPRHSLLVCLLRLSRGALVAALLARAKQSIDVLVSLKYGEHANNLH